MKGNLLIVEDDAQIRMMMRLYFETEGYNIFEAEDAEDAFCIFRTETIHLVFLDLMLPGMDGLEICRRLREHSDVAIIMITAKSQEEDKVSGFANGADEYVTKPFSLKVLAARAESLMRRVNGEVSKSDGRQQFDRLVIDKNNGSVMVDEKELVLTKKEYDLLLFLIKNKNIVLSREFLLEQVWGIEYDGDPRTLDTCMSRLRKKMGSQKNLIETRSGIGYCFREPTNNGEEQRK